MKYSTTGLAFAMAGAIVFSAMAAGPSTNVRGTITRVDGNILDIKTRGGGTAEVRLADNAKIVAVAKATLSDIKPGSFIGTAATPRTDGTLQAIEIHIFPESMRGTGEGTRTWDLGRKSSMTNGTVTQRLGKVANNKVSKVDGTSLTVEYNGGTKVVTTTPGTRIVQLVPGDRSELKPDVSVFIPGATKAADGTLEASRITVGSEEMPPPM
ncbi:MAG TPA: hypothetical protein VFB29_05900 [Pseudolabrys sp.]|nr:hypothetical protein [Pseudolabrys sp.]